MGFFFLFIPELSKRREGRPEAYRNLPGPKEVEAREAAEKRDSTEAEDRGTVPSPSPEGNTLTPKHWV